ncbi:cofilin [Hyaloscypha sp. PMI_1271]|nr:cofilin [Hyaloscypha sp. PMI_1271]
MSQSGVSVSPDCISKFNELKLNKKLKFIIYQLSDDYKQIVIEETSEDGDWEVFREKLLSAQSKSKTGKIGKGPRYAVYDFAYELANGEGSRSKITFIAWSPDDAGIQPKMVYASSKDALKRALNGIATEFQANDEEDIEYESVLKKVSKGGA